MTAEQQSDIDRINAALSTLGEHFDTVQIFATKLDGKDTATYQKGTGNWYARFGQVKMWVINEELIDPCAEDNDE